MKYILVSDAFNISKNKSLIIVSNISTRNTFSEVRSQVTIGFLGVTTCTYIYIGIINRYKLTISGFQGDDLLTQAGKIIILYEPKPFTFEYVS